MADLYPRSPRRVGAIISLHAAEILSVFLQPAVLEELTGDELLRAKKAIEERLVRDHITC